MADESDTPTGDRAESWLRKVFKQKQDQASDVAQPSSVKEDSGGNQDQNRLDVEEGEIEAGHHLYKLCQEVSRLIEQIRPEGQNISRDFSLKKYGLSALNNDGLITTLFSDIIPSDPVLKIYREVVHTVVFDKFKLDQNGNLRSYIGYMEEVYPDITAVKEPIYRISLLSKNSSCWFNYIAADGRGVSYYEHRDMTTSIRESPEPLSSSGIESIEAALETIREKLATATKEAT